MSEARRGIVIFGASKGVGKALRTRLSIGSALVIAASRSCHADDENGGRAIRCDIGRYADVRQVFEQLDEEREWSVVNCVGVGFYAPLTEDFSAYWEKILDANVLGLANILACAFQNRRMVHRCITLGSLAAFRPSRTPGNVVYSASKAACLPLLDEFRSQVRKAGSDMKITNVVPGFIDDTAWGEEFFNSRPDAAVPLYGSFEGLKADEVAAAIERLLLDDSPIEVSTLVLRPLQQPD